MRAIVRRAPATWVLAIVALAGFGFCSANGQSSAARGSSDAKSAVSNGLDKATQANPELAKTLKTAAEAVGLARWSGVGGQRLPEVDVVNTMEIWGSGTSWGFGRAYKAGEPWPAFKTEYHVALGYNPAAMRVEMTRTAAEGSSGAARHTIEVVSDRYAWDESEIGAGLIP